LVNKQPTIQPFNNLQLLSNARLNQLRFEKFLFHLVEFAVGIDFARKKKIFFTCFTQRKFILWKSGGLIFEFCFPNVEPAFDVTLYAMRN